MGQCLARNKILHSRGNSHLLLHNRQLLKVPLQKRHLLLLRFAVAVPDHIIILFLDFVKLYLKFNNLRLVSNLKIIQ